MSILIDTLKQELPPSLASLLDDAELRKDSEEYLFQLLVNEDLLSTENFTATSTEGQTTLTEEIAELEQKQRKMNVELAAITDKNRDLIIDISQQLQHIDTLFESGVSTELSAMAKIVGGTSEKFHIPVHERLDSSIKVSNSMLANIDAVLDILELPTICKLCILQGNYQEALEVSMLAQTLVIRFPKLAIFQKLHAQVDQELQIMVTGLIKLLNTNLKQNNILKIFQIFNKPDLIAYASAGDKSVQKDRFLKMIYLNARFKFITNELANLKPILSYNKLTYLKRFIEVYREFIFNSLSVFNAIFSSSQDDQLLISQFIKNLAVLLCKELHSYSGELFSIKDDFDEADAKSQKDSVILQLLYLCRSLSKYNVDFESILTWELCFKPSNPVITEEDWLENLSKIKKM